jgi:hypothetical protein
MPQERLRDDGETFSRSDWVDEEDDVDADS